MKKNRKATDETMTPEQRSLASARKRIRDKRRKKIIGWGVFLILAAAAAGIYFLFINDKTAINLQKNQGTADTGGEVKEYTVEQLAYADYVDISGSVEPFDSRDMVFKVSGTLTNIHVSEGDRVKAGDLLAEIENLSYVYDVENIKFQLEQAKDTSSLEYDLVNIDQQITQTKNDLNERYDLASIALQIAQKEDTSSLEYDLANIDKQI
ncbi:MAG: biotin/lipoyl-binding protein, partial [Spirochaetia bacterium]|nr:biotin/lipoyl-binding protein [Spirochaetia bacterium]